MKKLFFQILILGALSVPGFIFASHPTGLVPCHGTDCRACDFVQLGQNIITWLITVMTFIIALVFVVGGFQMVTSGGSSEAVSSARNKMTNAIIGLFIILLAWLIIDTVLKLLLKENGSLLGKPWHTVACVDNPSFTASGGTGGGGGGTGGGGTGSGGGAVTSTGGKYTDADARTILTNAGISINKSQAEGTSLEGINKSTIADVINLKNVCGCNVIFTGGTESTGGHAGGSTSHGSGHKYDVGLNPELTNYIQTNYTSIGNRSDGAKQYVSPAGNVYALESNHWDVVVK